MTFTSHSHQEFLKIVNDDIRGNADPKYHTALRKPESARMWLDALLELKRSCETQLAEDKALRSEARLKTWSKEDWSKFVAERDRWRAGTIRFKNGIENKIAEASTLQTQNLAQAIAAHHKAILAAAPDDDTSVADEKLWAEVGLRFA